MLQQTRVAAVIPYYEGFLAAFPDVHSLARASEQQVLARWSGLGYYTRARHLHRAARMLARHHGGRLPSDPETLGTLPGIGRYTLGAVLSIAFDQPWAVLDGNVARVLSRLFAVRGGSSPARARERLWQIAERLVPRRRPGDFNQALMELGATLCTPRAPRCGVCPLRRRCRALARGNPETFPAARPRPRARRIEVVAGLVESRRGLWLERGLSGANRDLFDLPSVERQDSGVHDLERLAAHLASRRIRVGAWSEVGRIRHGILDRNYVVHVYRAPATHARTATKGTWLGPDAHEIPLTARARKAIALLESSSGPPSSQNGNGKPSS